tara:strand:+ start:1091 stop:1480 length:390 start_codon:yes stop_codon:yes gene_type:complete
MTLQGSDCSAMILNYISNESIKYIPMKKLDDRKKGFEGKFARDQELEFKILARRNKYLGVWAAEKLGLSGKSVEEYFAEVVKSDLEEDGDMDVFRKVRKDFDDKGIAITDDELRQNMDQFTSSKRRNNR